jgi:hypothetical protein
MIDRDALVKLARNIEQHAFRRGSVSAFTLAAYPVEPHDELTLHITRECEGMVFGNAEVGSLDAMSACVDALDGHVDYIIYDTALLGKIVHPDNIREWSKRKSVLLPYSDLGVWVASVRHLILALLPDFLLAKTVIVTKGEKAEPFASRLAIDLAWFCQDIWIYNIGDDAGETPGTRDGIFGGADIIIGGAVYQQVIKAEDIKRTGKKPIIIDAGIGTITSEAAEYARLNGLMMIRVDNRAAMAGTLFSIIQSHDLVSRVMGKGDIDGVPVVAGGIVGEPGTLIIDSINSPVQVIGIADGTGKVRYEPSDDSERRKLDIVKKAVERGTNA